MEIIDQTKLPHVFESCRLEPVEAAAAAIRDMQVRGAPLIGAMAAYGMALAMRRLPWPRVTLLAPAIPSMYLRPVSSYR